VAQVTEKRFAEINDADRIGQEEFDSEEEMYAAFSVYYGQPVTSATTVKIVRFSLGRDG